MREVREVYVGVDFGTRFTKVAIGLEGLPRRIWRDSLNRSLIPSIVHVSTDGSIVPYPKGRPNGLARVEYLKMLVARPAETAFTSLQPELFDRPVADLAEPLAAAYLSELLRRIRASEQQKLGNVDARWVVNVGIPVQHCDGDGPARAAFRRVGGVAYEWSGESIQALDLDALDEHYRMTLQRIDLDRSPVSIVPELTAALHEFFRDPNRREGLYAFCDVGGGTLDLAVFRINRHKNIVPLSIPSAEVDVLGTMALSQIVASRLATAPERLEGFFVQSGPTPELKESAVRDAKERVQALCRRVVNDARLKQTGHTFFEDGNASNPKKPLMMFMSGGGAASSWYRTVVRGTRHGDTDGAFDGLTGIRPELVPKPRHFADDHYWRYVVALGLADEPESMEDAMLPPSIPTKEPLPTRTFDPPVYEKR